jgi:hypothetical protein
MKPTGPGWAASRHTAGDVPANNRMNPSAVRPSAARRRRSPDAGYAERYVARESLDIPTVLWLDWSQMSAKTVSASVCSFGLITMER